MEIWLHPEIVMLLGYVISKRPHIMESFVKYKENFFKKIDIRCRKSIKSYSKCDENSFYSKTQLKEIKSYEKKNYIIRKAHRIMTNDKVEKVL